MQLNDAIHNEKSLSPCPSRSSAGAYAMRFLFATSKLLVLAISDPPY